MKEYHNGPIPGKQSLKLRRKKKMHRLFLLPYTCPSLPHNVRFRNILLGWKQL